jgi:hypothetical protein
MTKKTVTATAMLTVFLAGLSVRGDDEAKSADPLANKGYGEKLQAVKWVEGDWKLEGTINLAGKKPQNFVSYRHIEWSLDNNFLVTTITQSEEDGGKLIHRSIIGWDPDGEQITEWGFWASGDHEEVTWKPRDDQWLITREGLKGAYTIVGPNKHHYEATFKGDEGKWHRWHFTATRK